MTRNGHFSRPAETDPYVVSKYENPYFCLFAVGVVTRGWVVCVLESDPPIVCSPLFTSVIIVSITIVSSLFQHNQTCQLCIAKGLLLPLC